MLYKHFIHYIFFTSLLIAQTACDNTKQSHMLSGNQSLQQETSHIQDSKYSDLEHCTICLKTLSNPAQ